LSQATWRLPANLLGIGRGLTAPLPDDQFIVFFGYCAAEIRKWMQNDDVDRKIALITC
jgi:hypothetical protein